MEYTWYNCEKLLNFPKLDTSNVTTLSLTWFDCKLLTTFPEINTSNVTNVYSTWSSCSSLECINGTLDFTNIINKTNTFYGCNNLIYPSISGTTVRNGDHALNGLWVNPNDC
jgi:surface protein